MAQTRDYSDGQVKGLDRFFPTTLSRALLVSLLTLPLGSFWLILAYSEQLMPQQTHDFKNLVALSISLFVALVILVSMVVELVVVLHQSKHRRVKHFTNEHPQMSFMWLWKNAQSKHIVFVLTVFTLRLACGYNLWQGKAGAELGHPPCQKGL